jgi:RimJ/RimL family protein N-acetyltransferase
VTVPYVSLIALDTENHVDALQRVYELTPTFWDLYGLLSAPEGQGERDLKAIDEESGRYGMGILLPNEPGNTDAGAQLVGLIDFRLHWPEQGVCYVGMLMVAEPFQRQGIGTEAWLTLEPWLANEAKMHTVRLGVEQFNPDALKFFESLGFQLTGQSQRVRSGKRLVRLLYMEKPLKPDTSTT